jgi:hypothetical protein
VVGRLCCGSTRRAPLRKAPNETNAITIAIVRPKTIAYCIYQIA